VLANLLYDVKGSRAFHQGDDSNPDLIGIKALDESTLSVELENPTGYFLSLIATYFLPVPTHMVNKFGDNWVNLENIVTNGPFKIVSWKSEQFFVLERNRNFHGNTTGNIQTVRCLAISTDIDEDLLKFEDHNLDLLDMRQFPPIEIERLRQRYIEDYAMVPNLGTFYVGFDVSRPPFDDLKVRQAFALAINKEHFASVVMMGTVSPATGGLIPPGMPGHSPGVASPYDPELARKLLADAGYNTKKDNAFQRLKALTVAHRSHNHALDYLADQWLENLGIEITWKQLEFDEFYEILDCDVPHIYLSAWTADYPDPNSFLDATSWRRTTGWDHEEFNRLVAKAKRIMDQEKRMRIYHQAEVILMEESPIIPLFYSRQHYLVKPWVRKFAISPIYDWYFKDIILEPH